MIEEEHIEALLYKYVKPEMVLSFGTGPTNENFLKKLGLFTNENNMNIKVVPTSHDIGFLCAELGIKTVSLDDTEIDLAFDFVDQVDPDFNYISNETTSLIRDKMIAVDAAEFIVVCNEKNFVSQMIFDFRVEVSNFAFNKTLYQLMNLGEAHAWKEKGEIVKSETGNYFIDVKADSSIYSIDDLDYQAKKIPGVLETSLFIGFADRALLHGENNLIMKSRMTNEE
ncbi:MAG: ribose-5-phosphate isomerase A [Candidatus Diapherotrites archaeon]|jgi:ribose 5-phosphate isomerase A|uniref:ribose-5-phosphate isomerase n=1 Tax=Candidatus Iainarchaeum sp. TaxID=3101447 RepID=A0A7K4BZC3_9ARCH|nr:ribose-5-phosphate isomerase A [Candidatus Diapherotrites archaeon]